MLRASGPPFVQFNRASERQRRDHDGGSETEQPVGVQADGVVTQHEPLVEMAA